MIGGLGTWSAVIGPAGASNPGYWTTGDQTLPGGAKTFTGGPWTFTRTAVASSAETIATFKVSDDSASYFEFRNGSSADSRLDPLFRGVGGTSQVAIRIQALGTQDSGSNAGIKFSVGTSGGAAFTTRPLCEWDNNGSIVLQMLPLNSGSNSFLSWGTQTGAAPAFTTRSAGTRLVLLSNIGASTVDYAMGYESSHLWWSCEAAQNARGFKWYGGTTAVMTLRGDGRLATTGGRVVALRVATTTPVTAAVTDEVIIAQLGTPGAVAVNLFATPTTGTRLTIKDGTGDAAANNITITPAAGNIDGAGTLVINANYGKATLVYNGTQWNQIA